MKPSEFKQKQTKLQSILTKSHPCDPGNVKSRGNISWGTRISEKTRRDVK